jgi:hypothetical protein
MRGRGVHERTIDCNSWLVLSLPTLEFLGPEGCHRIATPTIPREVLYSSIESTFQTVVSGLKGLPDLDRYWFSQR